MSEARESCTLGEILRPAGEARLTVSDNGRGFQTPKGNGSGLKLIESLARQIGGHVQQESSAQGTTTAITFPIIT